MIKHKDHFHGSDLEKIEKIYGIKKEDIVSFSANVNPLGISPMLKEGIKDQIDCITTYPDRDYVQLRQCIANYCSTETENIIVGNGSTELTIQVDADEKHLDFADKIKKSAGVEDLTLIAYDGEYHG